MDVQGGIGEVVGDMEGDEFPPLADKLESLP
jgi:hypothetical protein